ncbi:amino acid ABC transporter permease [Aquamicrobium sp. LC103]|uniref:amino acid ABC transporter permease n=1 Tax=Aquamicrobium sp. LC103 TaxID=1120658 RepID=UPI00063E8CCC|nr:amino acid ABC transporter permease [Aquamicrobium sp. LC103]TKT78324.1 amino acid ABC transporter permease [Aquamicrobium sp. LC103]
MTYGQILWGIFEGFRVTGLVTVLGLAYAIPFAFIFGILQHIATGWKGAPVTIFIEFWRSSPVIVLLFAFYYTLPLFGVTLSALSVAAMVLGMNIGGYGSQAVRAALQALDRGQTEAGLAIGLTRSQVLAYVELPQAIMAMVPTFMNQFIQLIKSTALVSLITLTDMTYRAKEISQIVFDPVAVYSALLLAYLIICYPVTVMGRHIEKRVTKGRRASDAI